MREVEKKFDEKERVSTLKEYNILDSQPEEEYDDIAKLAAEICETSIAAISLIDDHRLWFKSQVGAELKINSIPKDVSMCVHVLSKPDNTVLVVPDCNEDGRFCNNLVVKGKPKMKFYAAAPLVTPEGYTIGALCVLDQRSRELSSCQTKTLKVLANQIMKILELRKLNAKLVGSRIKLQNRYKELEQFSYAVSHDLRGPVKNISALIGLMDMQLKTDKQEDMQLYMGKIVNESDRMNNLIGDLLEFSLVGKNKQEKEWIGMKEVLDGVKLSMEFKLAENKVQLNYTGEVDKIVAMKTDISRLLQNLIENAIKFRRRNTDPEIKVSCTEEASHWKIAVQDNGIGMNPRDTGKIFEVFSRLHTSDQYQGTGIGLAMCKRIAENHEGNIWVESSLNEGSSFYVTVRK